MTEEFGRFFLPGPSEVHPEVLAAMQRPMIAHRSAECAELMDRVQPVLQQLFGTTRPVLIGACSATGFMEAGIRLLAPGRVLALVNGAFSERFALIAEACGHEVERRVVDWGRAHDSIGDTGGFCAVLVAHNETSTGVVQPIAKIAKAIAPTPLLVDSTSGLGGAELNFDQDDLAYALTGSQKALALPPGLAFAVVREDLLEQASGSFYFDLRRYAENPPPFTPALPQLYALAAQVERIAEEGIGARLARHQAMAERVWEWAADRRILADPAHRSPTVSCILEPESDALRARLSEQGFTIGNGYGKLKGKAFRIGHMGDQNLASLDRLLATIGG
ncbi:MAG: pyridoxal-phosphate-dependent aminotransferase family protein [Planctomycetota bacterium]|jgi:aspartate aminotransferase-like enzyme